uniref:Uncharacterized protein n=1 Tax=Cucumis melo TaxID=3656 RepID=A0A9I9EAE4_CUCME
MSGTTPWAWKPQKWVPVRPNPAWTSSAIHKPPAFLTTLYASPNLAIIRASSFASVPEFVKKTTYIHLTLRSLGNLEAKASAKSVMALLR